MIITVESARQEWTMRLKEQARQLRVIASAAQLPDMREELDAFASRIDAQLMQMDARAA